MAKREDRLIAVVVGRVAHLRGCCAINPPWLFWQQSTDNLDPQSVIRYDVYVNGVFDHSLLGADRTVVYGNPGVENTYQVIAVDSATLTTCAAAFC